MRSLTCPAPMAKKLVIVESPAKAKTIAGYLGSDFVVESSIGHIRDLPESRLRDPEEVQAGSPGALGVDVENGFEPLYVVDPDKKKRRQRAQAQLKDADELLLATDEDREGEAIAWHLLEELKPKVPGAAHGLPRDHARRDPAALGETRDVDQRLVDAQETRRILDRLYGYEVSPVLWKKVMQGLSAGRVQSVAVAARRRARARAPRLRLGRLLGHQGQVRPRLVRGAARRRSTASASRRAATSRRTAR